MGANNIQAWLRPLFVGLMALAIFNTAARAELGGTLESVYSDQKASAATSQQTLLATGNKQFTQHQADGVTVRQYVNSAGRVFGVAWEGPLLPDFQRLLGDHYAAYSEAQRQPSRHINIQSAELVLNAGGMMRSFSGRAYLPKLLPPTLAAADIR